jgi:hypothetical protein
MMEDKTYYTVMIVNKFLKYLPDLRYKYYRMVVKYQSYITEEQIKFRACMLFFISEYCLTIYILTVLNTMMQHCVRGTSGFF